MRENYEAIGFIPQTTIADRYIRKHRYVLQEDERGHNVGYLLHGAIQCGAPCVISQHVIQYEKRLHGYGEQALQTLLERCEYGGASSIHLRCADTLPSVQFWQSCGFQALRVVPGGMRRQRMIIEMYYPLALPLFRV